MKILHVSDNHGHAPPLKKGADVIIHSGDLLPNKTRGIREVEETFQEAWCRKHLQRLCDWIGNTTFLYVPGNHDYYDPCPMLRAAGLDAHLINGCHYGTTASIGGLLGVKWFTGEWNHEVSEAEIAQRLEDISYCDILVSHGPPFGVLDRSNGERCGSKALRQWLQTVPIPPSLVLCGHIHEGYGLVSWARGIEVSNAATNQRLITWGE